MHRTDALFVLFQVVKRARDAFRAGKTRPIAQRKKLLEDLLRMITEKEQDIVDAMRRDLHKVC